LLRLLAHTRNFNVSAGASTLISETLKRFGALDLLVNNAATNKAAPLDQVTEKSLDEHFAANVKSALFMSQAAASVFKPGAVIINISPLNSGYPSGHLYSATKAALESLTISPSRKLGPRGIRVVVVAPGMVDTQMLRANNKPEALNAMIERNVLHRIGKADEIAAVVAFLATHNAGFLTDETYILTAGGGCVTPRSLPCYRFRHNVFRRILPGPAHARERRLAQEIAGTPPRRRERSKCPEVDLASGSWVEIVYRRT
jgi:3-oxoacyl-[acyl-carrier protein] reductase